VFLYVQKRNGLVGMGAYVQKLRDLKSCGMCRCEANLYLQKLNGLENAGITESCICTFCGS